MTTQRFRCSMCDADAVALYYMPEGCNCRTDIYQGLCRQHIIKAENNPMYFILSLDGTASKQQD